MGRIPAVMSQSVERYGLAYIRPRHEEIARRLVNGETPINICRQMGYTPGRLSIIINSGLFKVKLAKLSQLRDDKATDIQQELADLQPIALGQVAKTAMSSPSESLRLKASQDLLDRGGNIKKGGGISINIGMVEHPVDLSMYAADRVIEAEVVGKPGGNGDSGVHAVNAPDGNTEEADLEKDMELLDAELMRDVAEPEPELGDTPASAIIKMQEESKPKVDPYIVEDWSSD